MSQCLSDAPAPPLPSAPSHLGCAPLPSQPPPDSSPHLELHNLELQRNIEYRERARIQASCGCKRNTGTFPAVPELWEKWGRGGAGANPQGSSTPSPALLSAPCFEKGWYSLLRRGRNVPCVSCGLCPVLHWPLYIYTSFSSRGILLSVTLLSSALLLLGPMHSP